MMGRSRIAAIATLAMLGGLSVSSPRPVLRRQETNWAALPPLDPPPAPALPEADRKRLEAAQAKRDRRAAKRAGA